MCLYAWIYIILKEPIKNRHTQYTRSIHVRNQNEVSMSIVDFADWLETKGSALLFCSIFLFFAIWYPCIRLLYQCTILLGNVKKKINRKRKMSYCVIECVSLHFQRSIRILTLQHWTTSKHHNDAMHYNVIFNGRNTIFTTLTSPYSLTVEQIAPLCEAYMQGRYRFLVLKIIWYNQSDTTHHIDHRQSLLSDHRAFGKCSKAYFELLITAPTNQKAYQRNAQVYRSKEICFITLSSFSKWTGMFSPCVISSQTSSNPSAPESMETCTWENKVLNKR